MADLLEGILAYSKESNIEEVYSWVNLQKVIVQVEDNLSEQLKESKSSVLIGNHLPEVFGSSTRIYQMFHNLLLNAVKYRNPEEDLSILVESFKEQKEYTIVIHDNGLGIPIHMKDRVFDPFERYHLDIPGSGLGLAMVKKHMIQHGGTVHLKSTEGLGSSFFLNFPLEICRNPVPTS